MYFFGVKRVLGALILALPGMALAQEPEQFGDWVRVCEGEQPCRLVYQQTMRESRELVLRLIAMKTRQGAIMAAYLPMGVHFPSGAVFRMENASDGAQEQMIWQRCHGEICEAAIQLDAELLDKFDQDEAILFAYRMNPKEEPRVMRVRLEGFSEGLAQTGE